jgi:SOS response regulatory protein OraA/RecX
VALPTVTALRELGPTRVLVELDGSPWRALPADAVVRGGLGLGVALDRPQLRQLAREVRRSAALSAATRALRARDLSRRRLDERLERAGVPPAARREAVERLVRAGLVDDERFAAARARALADRHYGEAAIAWRLAQEGVAAELVAGALAGLEPEGERAQRAVAARGGGTRHEGWLARRGFSEEAIECALAGFAGGDG